jgi:hypothetical protein
VDRNGSQGNEAGVYGPEIRSSRIEAFFAWQNGRDYRQCACIKPSLFLADAKRPEQRIPGTAPDNDPA